MAQQIKIKTGIIAVLALALVYAGCKKDSKSPPTASAQDKQASLQVVRDVMNVITGGLGDPSYSNLAVGSVGQQHSKLSVQSTTGSGCAFTIDTAFNLSVTEDTVQVSVKGPFKLSSTCGTGGQSYGSIGFIGNYVEVYTTPSLSLTFNVNQNTVETGVSVADSTITVLNGTESVSEGYSYKNGKTGTQVYTFKFNAVNLGPTTLQPLSGATDYTAKVTGIFGDWSYSGTITFISSSQVKITLGGNTFMVNVITGEVAVAT
jgi:hypothetical protein